jgi:hypothetical protein
MNINSEDLKKLLEKAFDLAIIGYKATKEDCINKIIEDYISINCIKYNESATTLSTTTLTTSFENNNLNYYSYYACPNGSQTQPLNNDFI